MESKYFQDKFKKIKFRLKAGLLAFITFITILILAQTPGLEFLLLLGIPLVPFCMIFFGAIRDYLNYKKFENRLLHSFPEGFSYSQLTDSSDLMIPYLDIFIFKRHIFLLGKKTIFIENLNNISYIRMAYESSPPISWTDMVIKNHQDHLLKWEVPHSRDFSPETIIGRMRTQEALEILFDYLDKHFPVILKKFDKL